MRTPDGITVSEKTISCRFEKTPKEFLENKFFKLGFNISRGVKIVLVYLLTLKPDEFKTFMTTAIDKYAEWEESRRNEIKERNKG